MTKKEEKRMKGDEQGGLRPLRDSRVWNSATASGVPSHWPTPRMVCVHDPSTAYHSVLTDEASDDALCLQDKRHCSKAWKLKMTSENYELFVVVSFKI